MLVSHVKNELNVVALGKREIIIIMTIKLRMNEKKVEWKESKTREWGL